MSAPENPPAFPTVPQDGLGYRTYSNGMDLRDWFAGQALAAAGTWLPIGYANLSSLPAHAARARWAYAAANALLAERAK